jgi:hypothetical protein
LRMMDLCQPIRIISIKAGSTVEKTMLTQEE